MTNLIFGFHDMDFIEQFLLLIIHVDRMQAYCEYRAKQGLIVNLAMPTLESKYPELRYYYEALGVDRIKALNYKEKKLLNEIHIMKTKNKIRSFCLFTIFLESQSHSSGRWRSVS